jgi:hypothetical protein
LSFEKDSFLVQQFLNFLHGEENPVYQQIANLIGPVDEIKNYLLRAYENKNWQIQSALGSGTVFTDKYQVIFYDAFSSRCENQLWSQDFLSTFIDKACAENCVFSTYACTGNLKRALKSAGFQVILREGFHGKRNSTLAVRGYKA